MDICHIARDRMRAIITVKIGRIESRIDQVIGTAGGLIAARKNVGGETETSEFEIVVAEIVLQGDAPIWNDTINRICAADRHHTQRVAYTAPKTFVNIGLCIYQIVPQRITAAAEHHLG